MLSGRRLGVLKGSRILTKSKTLGYTIRFICYLLILLPAALGVLYVHAFGVSVVRRDAWSMVPLFDRWSSGKLQVSDFFVQHNEHRSAFPEIAELLLGVATKYNNVAEMYLIQICLFVTLVVLLLAFRANNKTSLGLFLFFPISLLVFSFRQEANMLFGYQINFAFVVTFGVLTLFLLYVLGYARFKKSAFAAALVSATVATYSIVGGLLVWPAGLFQLLLSPLEKPQKRVFIILWSLVGFFVWVTYFRGWENGTSSSSFIDWGRPGTEPGDWYVPSGTEPDTSSASSFLHPSFLNALEHPLEGIQFFLNLLGSSLFWPQQRTFEGGLFGEHLGVVAGLLLICLALIVLLLVYKDRRLGQYSFWVSLMFYSFLILASITARSSDGGPELALAPRYTSFSILAIVSIYGLLATTALQRRCSIRRPSISAILLVLLSGTVVLSAATISYPKGIRAGSSNKTKEEKLAFVLATYESQPDELVAEVSDVPSDAAQLTRERALVLQRLGYNVFSDPRAQQGFLPPLSALSPVASSTFSGGIDALGTDTESDLLRTGQENRPIVVPQEEASFIKLEGWAVDVTNQSLAGGVYIDIDGKLFPAFYGTVRRDVVRYFRGNRAYKYSGFERAIPLSEIGAGSHELSIVVLTPDRKGYYRPNQKVVFEVR